MFDQPPRQQHALPVNVAAIAIAHRVGLLRQIEGLAGIRPGQQIERPLLEAGRLGGGEFGPLLVDRTQQLAARIDPRITDVVDQAQLFHLPIGTVRIA